MAASLFSKLSFAKIHSSWPILSLIVSAIGFLVLLCFAIRILKGIYIYFIRPRQNIYKKYGATGCWALITGASDGIGLAYAKNLAKLGFNIILAARDKAKLQEKEAELLKLAPTIKVKCVVIDFSLNFSESNYAPLIDAIEKTSPITILVNNVGLGNSCDFDKFPYDKLTEILNVNIESATFTTRLVLPKMLALAPQRCGVITISSLLSEVKSPGLAIYTATKSYLNYFMGSLTIEFKGKNVDFLNCKPGPVLTKVNPKSSPMHISPEEAAEWELSFLGRETEVYGHWKHALASLALKIPPIQKAKCNEMRVGFMKHWGLIKEEEKKAEASSQVKQKNE